MGDGAVSHAKRVYARDREAVKKNREARRHAWFCASRSGGGEEGEEVSLVGMRRCRHTLYRRCRGGRGDLCLSLWIACRRHH